MKIRKRKVTETYRKRLKPIKLKYLLAMTVNFETQVIIVMLRNKMLIGY